MPLNQGQILNNRYRIVKLLGQGGYGAVYRAWDMVLKIPVGVKENYAISPASQAQFLREASLLANLNHPNLPRVTDHFVIAGQGQYLVMDFVEGIDLQEMLDRCSGPLPEVQVLPWIAQICDALTYMHSQTEPVIHRDIKPDNIKITPDGRAILVDFGIAKIYDPHKRTTGGARAATPGYAPFEQYGQAPTDARTDVYALGATLYALLTCQPPTESIARVAGSALLMPRALNPTITPTTEQAILHALEVIPDKRFAHSADFKFALFPPSKPSVIAGTAINKTAQISSIPPGQVAPSAQDISSQSQHVPPIPASQSVPAPVFPPARKLKIFQSTGLGALGLLFVIGAILIGNQQINRTPAKPTTTHTVLAIAVLPTRTKTLIPTPTALPTSPATLLPGFTPSPTFTPALDLVKTQASTQDGMPMVYIPAGTFTMGSTDPDKVARSDEKPQHTVYLDAFWIDLTEVTNIMFTKFVVAMNYKTAAEVGGWGYAWTGSTWVQVNGANWRHPFGPDSNINGQDKNPVVQVSWNDAKAYCEWVGRRLPSEAQWEKAARGPDGRIYPWGNQPPAGNLLNFADRNLNVDYADQNVDDGYEFSSPVGKYPAGASYYGVLDMAGNVWEWVADWYDATYYTKSPGANPFGPISGESRILRGGSWRNDASNVRAAIRSSNLPEFRLVSLGFRCVR